MAVVLPVRQRTDEWLEARRHGIGASQAAAAIGVSEFQSPIGLWAEKLGLVPPEPENVSMRIGTALEPLIAEMYTEATGVKVRRATQLRQHREHPFMLASIDRRAGRKPVELKYSARATGYGEPGTDEVPDDVLVQVLHQLAVLDEPEGDVALVKPGASGVLIYPIRRTPDAEAAIVEREATFWDHVLSRTQPPVDGSDATARALAAMYPRGAELATLDATDDVALAGAMGRLRIASQEIAALEAQAELAKAEIKAAMLAAGAEKVLAAGLGEIPWRAIKDRTTTDWRLVAAAYRALLERAQAVLLTVPGVADQIEPIELDAIESLHTETKPTSPRFGPPKWFTEEE